MFSSVYFDVNSSFQEVSPEEIQEEEEADNDGGEADNEQEDGDEEEDTDAATNAQEEEEEDLKWLEWYTMWNSTSIVATVYATIPEMHFTPLTHVLSDRAWARITC